MRCQTRPNRFLIVFIVIFSLSDSLASSVTNEAQSTSHQFDGPYPFRFLAQPEKKECKVVEECSLCDAISRENIPECAQTGRIERLSCEPPNDEEGSGAVATKQVHRSCRRTKADDEFLMVRLQVLCVLIGAAAFMFVRREKRASASLFDQRKQAEAAKRRQRDSSSSNAIEMTRMEETVPLTSMPSDLEEV